jgi:glyoxylase-like metal-dependent hydrolase (beta-lactamase superfamily II)
MNIEVRYYSKSGNTKKIVDAIAKQAGVSAKSIREPVQGHVDILFLGTGIYAFDIDPELKEYIITALYTPGHSPGHLCFWEAERGYLFTGDLVYKDTLFAYYPSTDPRAYLVSLEKIATLPVRKVFPAHHSLDIQPEILLRMRDAFRALNAECKLLTARVLLITAIGLFGCNVIIARER